MKHQHAINGKTLPDIKKMLIIRADGIGDMLNATPAIALLRQNYPSAEITVLARPLNAPVLHGNPDVDRVLIFDKRDKHRGLKGNLKFFHSIRLEKFDLVVALHTATIPNFIAYILEHNTD